MMIPHIWCLHAEERQIAQKGNLLRWFTTTAASIVGSLPAKNRTWVVVKNGSHFWLFFMISSLILVHSNMLFSRSPMAHHPAVEIKTNDLWGRVRFSLLPN